MGSCLGGSTPARHDSAKRVHEVKRAGVKARDLDEVDPMAPGITSHRYEG